VSGDAVDFDLLRESTFSFKNLQPTPTLKTGSCLVPAGRQIVGFMNLRPSRTSLMIIVVNAAGLNCIVWAELKVRSFRISIYIP
jgi:hypothetical protein